MWSIHPLSVKHTGWTLHICFLSLLTSIKSENLSCMTIVVQIQIVLTVDVVFFTTCLYCYDKSKCQVSTNTIPGLVHDIDASGNAGVDFFRDQSHFNVIEFAQ